MATQPLNYDAVVDSLDALAWTADKALEWLNSAMQDPALKDALLDHMPNNYSRRMLCQSIADARRALEN